MKPILLFCIAQLMWLPLSSQTPVKSWEKAGLLTRVKVNSRAELSPTVWSKSLTSVNSSCAYLLVDASQQEQELFIQRLARKTRKPVYRLDGRIWKKAYIGETEKNLSRIIRQAEQQGWILFFDEADALFGKRTSVTSSSQKWLAKPSGTIIFSLSKEVSKTKLDGLPCKRRITKTQN